MTRTLLYCGAIAGPLYILVAAVQAVTRDGFDITQHAVSLLANGEYGWVQVLNFVIAGALVAAGAVGIHRVTSSGSGRFWGPVLLTVFGVGMIGSGLFIADPSHGFPPGTPAGEPEQVTFSGIMHFTISGIAFLGFVGACIVFARRFRSTGENDMAVASYGVGALYLVAFGIVAVTGGSSVGNVLLTIAVILGWVWLSTVSLRAVSQSSQSHRTAPQGI